MFKKKNLSVQKICCTTVTERTLAKVLSLSTWGNSYPRTKRKLLSIILKIPTFSYALLWFQVVVPSFLARACDMRKRYSALSGASGKRRQQKTGREWEKYTPYQNKDCFFFCTKSFAKISVVLEFCYIKRLKCTTTQRWPVIITGLTFPRTSALMNYLDYQSNYQ